MGCDLVNRNGKLPKDYRFSRIKIPLAKTPLRYRENPLRFSLHEKLLFFMPDIQKEFFFLLASILG